MKTKAFKRQLEKMTPPSYDRVEPRTLDLVGVGRTSNLRMLATHEALLVEPELAENPYMVKPLFNK